MASTSFISILNSSESGFHLLGCVFPVDIKGNDNINWNTPRHVQQMQLTGICRPNIGCREVSSCTHCLTNALPDVSVVALLAKEGLLSPKRFDWGHVLVASGVEHLVLVKIAAPGIGPHRLVHVSIYQGKPFCG